MSTLNASLVASTSRPLALRCRADLVSAPQEYEDRTYWVVKEPIGLRYYRLEDQEFTLLSWLDGQVTMEQLKQQFESRFAPHKIGYEEISRLLVDFHQRGLVYSTAGGQGEQLYRLDRRRIAREWLGRLANPLSMRFRGIQPQRLFDLLYPATRWMFSPVVVATNVLLMLAALTLLLVQFDEFTARLPAFHQFFTFETTLYLMAVLAVTKIWHELGHGLACKHFGREVPELGVMLLVFAPCLYCNVSDSWLLKNKWQRVAIGAAGMYFELVLAALATLVWWFSVPGLVHHLALNVMFVCSVTTLLFNANPLLRYDGYYMLADVLEIPNLSQKASAVVRRALSQTLLGTEPTDDPFLPRRHRLLFGLYAVAAAIYRWTVTTSILWFLYQMFKPYRLEVVAQVFGLVAVAGMVGQPLWALVQFVRVPGRSQQVKPARLKGALAGAAAIIAAALFIPLPHRVFGTFTLEPQNPQHVFVEVPGRLVEIFARPGDVVSAGAKLARLENTDLDITIGKLSAERDHYRAQLAALRHRRFNDPSAGLQVPEVQKTLTAFEDQLCQKLADRDRLTLVADRAGTVLPAPESPAPPDEAEQLPAWYGSPFESRNAHCYLDESTLLCRVGNPQAYEALVVLDQADVSFVAVGQQVVVQLDALPFAPLTGEVAEISRLDLKVSPRQLSNKRGGELATRTDASGIERPLAVSYQVRVPIAGDHPALRTALRGRAKVHVAPESLAAWAWRAFWQTFHFRF